MTDAATLVGALAAVQANLPPIVNGSTAKVPTKSGGSYEYSYADLAAITPLILPLLGAHGLAWIAKPMLTDDGRFVLRYKLAHTSGEVEGGDYPLPDPNRGTPQEIGSAITYARRYTLCSVVGLAPDKDDDDAAAASKAKPKVTRAEPRPQTRQTSAQAPQPDRRDDAPSGPAGDDEAPSEGSQLTEAERKAAGAFIAALPPALRGKEASETRHQLYALAAENWGIGLHGLDGRSKNRVQKYAAGWVGGKYTIDVDGNTSLRLVDTDTGDVVATVTNDLPSAQPRSGPPGTGSVAANASEATTWTRSAPG